MHRLARPVASFGLVAVLSLCPILIGRAVPSPRTRIATSVLPASVEAAPNAGHDVQLILLRRNEQRQAARVVQARTFWRATWLRAELARQQRDWLLAAARWQTAASRPVLTSVRVVQQSRPYVPPPPPPAQGVSFGGLSSVVSCIKSHESGNYSESSHPSTGSGAYQFVPGTWQTYDRLAGYPGGVYSLAYLAPPWVQDAVLAYALTHGGAHNWDPKYGNDPCTVGLP